MFFHCRVCGKRTSYPSWPWNVCESCEPYQQAVNRLVEAYQGEIPEAALKALANSLHQYDSRTGERVADQKAGLLRGVMAQSQRRAFGGAFRLPSMLYVDACGLYRSILTLVLESELLPVSLAGELKTYLASIEERKQRLARIATYQFNARWHACLVGDDPDAEPVTGESEVDALQKLYAAHPEFGSLSA